ncbi:hypothetical protein SUNI508_11680 [Seiridium unicorne]|uniref:Uncharacterized protein n=1 Tax=Seiridium unicorne TaxID=138068 RepID=A0ABR2UGJ2_9PEZI
MRFILPVILFLADLVYSDQPSVAAGRFINPANALDTPASYGETALWTVDEVQTIKFTTTYSNYTIALWQQSNKGGSALLGPVIFQTQTSVFPQFDWVVQSFDFYLTLSPVFFLWLHAGTASDQGAPESLSLPSYGKDGVLSYSLDIVNEDELKLWIQATVDKSGKLDGAVNYAALDDNWNEIIHLAYSHRVNLTGKFYSMRAQGAVIVDVGGVLGIVGLVGNAPCSAS